MGSEKFRKFLSQRLYNFGQRCCSLTEFVSECDPALAIIRVKASPQGHTLYEENNIVKHTSGVDRVWRAAPEAWTFRFCAPLSAARAVAREGRLGGLVALCGRAQGFPAGQLGLS